MLSSKANAALARLKEIEEKYKIKREEQKWNHKEDADSSISSVSIIPSENPWAELKKSLKNVSKLKLDIKIPDMRFEGRAEETKLSSESKKSTPDKMSPESFEDVEEADLDVTMPPKDKSPRYTGKQESLISDVTSIQEDSSIESVLDDSMISSKSLSRSKTLRGNFSTASNKSSKREERTKAPAKYKKERESDKSLDISKRKASSANSSITKQSRSFEKSNEKTVKVRSNLKSRERSIQEKVIIKIPYVASSDRSRSLRDDSVIEESIGTVDDGSEIISELSHAKTSITAKTDDSIKSSKYLAAENAFVMDPSSSRQLATESGYANDTFEDISSSTMRSQSQPEKIIDEKQKIDSLLEEYKHHQNNKSNRKGHIIELVALKPNENEINLEPFNYANDFANANLDNAIVRLIKSPKSASSRSEKRYQEHRPESFKTNTSSATNFDKKISHSSKSLTGVGDVTNTDEKKNLPEIRTTSVGQESGQEERGKASNKIRERAMINITGPPAADEKDIIKSSLSEEYEIEKENVLEKSSDQHISQDAEDVLRKLHKDAHDALIKRHASSKKVKEASEKSPESKTKSEIKDVIKTRKEMPREENQSRRSSEENKIYDRNSRKPSSQKKKKKSVKVTNSKSAQARYTGSRKEDKASRFDEKQMLGLEKQIVELRLQQERKDLQKYLQELKDSKLESGSTQSYFSPLEFPKIAEFTQPDAINLESKPDDQHIMLRERVSAIKQSLKDQYILYRDYCTMAQAINAHYVPTTLQDAKKTIRELQKMIIKSR
ncbi:myosin-2 heavy chain-like [Formica exsecta]|uniref:myosin-2 heavy chain-like n=1 Tax=Formica exsecta TaxID=72781 RepID=UPI001141BE32|nr:myosin-2 heavy chain-like [Formica exsecta]